ncbi:SPOR domain-containing protein [Stutzerimonas azotifigens]|uniref:SPOR domain-containing protein n=1 Tax=Stutzerimonas azotifigens TaxID=291995 RepID=UPI0004103C89|nr:SPOR domain-containing protein [Stutzerimonas azotifigens]
MAKRKATPKRGASRYQVPSKKPVPGWIWLACGLVVGAFAVFLLNLGPSGEEIKRPSEQAARPASKPQPAKPAEQPRPKYDFYTLLPESEVIVPPDALPPPPSKPVTPEEAAKIDAARAQAALNGETPPPPPTIAKAPAVTQFFLQAGSFRKREDADRVRAQILLQGHDVRVEAGTVREETWYRVLVGPYADREQLAQAQKKLAAGGYTNLLLQQRRGG